MVDDRIGDDVEVCNPLSFPEAVTYRPSKLLIEWTEAIARTA